jgi:predicted nucleotidyltransferase
MRAMKKNRPIQQKETDSIKKTLNNEEDLEIAVLIGSRANGSYSDHSDWDIAIQWNRCLDMMTKLGRTEVLRHKISKLPILKEPKIDLIDMIDAGLAMRSEIASNGVVLTGEDTPAWSRFLTRTWRELEEFYWDKIYGT